MFSCGFYNSLNGDRKYSAIQFGEMFDGLIVDGIYATIGEAFGVEPGGGMNVTVGTGRAWFNKTWSVNDAKLPLAIEMADLLLPRIDVVVLEVDTRTAVRDNCIKVITGSPAVTPAKPTLVNADGLYQYALAYIDVPANLESIVKSNIDNQMGRGSTPFVTGVLQSISIDDAWMQWEGQFDEWFAGIKSQLSGDIAANLQRQVEELKEGKVNVSDKATEEDVENGVADKWVDAEGLKNGLSSLYSVGDISYENSIIRSEQSKWHSADGGLLHTYNAKLFDVIKYKYGVGSLAKRGQVYLPVVVSQSESMGSQTYDQIHFFMQHALYINDFIYVPAVRRKASSTSSYVRVYKFNPSNQNVSYEEYSKSSNFSSTNNDIYFYYDGSNPILLNISSVWVKAWRVSENSLDIIVDSTPSNSNMVNVIAWYLDTNSNYVYIFTRPNKTFNKTSSEIYVQRFNGSSFSNNIAVLKGSTSEPWADETVMWNRCTPDGHVVCDKSVLSTEYVPCIIDGVATKRLANEYLLNISGTYRFKITSNLYIGISYPTSGASNVPLYVTYASSDPNVENKTETLNLIIPSDVYLYSSNAMIISDIENVYVLFSARDRYDYANLFWYGYRIPCSYLNNASKKESKSITADVEKIGLIHVPALTTYDPRISVESSVSGKWYFDLSGSSTSGFNIFASNIADGTSSIYITVARIDDALFPNVPNAFIKWLH